MAELPFVHHDNAAMASFMERVHNEYPNITKLYQIGLSVHGKFEFD